MTAARQHLGRHAEALAAEWYLAQGYDVLARNWRCAQGELDLVVARGPLLVFVEVKARTSDRFGTPAEAVTGAKQARIRRLAASWMAASGPRRHGAVRFDVAGVSGGRVEVLEGAF